MLLQHRHCIHQLTRSSYLKVCNLLTFPDHQEETLGGTLVAVAQFPNKIENEVQHGLGNAIDTYEDEVSPEDDDYMQSYPEVISSWSCSKSNSASGIEHSGLDDYMQSYPGVIGSKSCSDLGSASDTEGDVFDGFHQSSMFSR